MIPSPDRHHPPLIKTKFSIPQLHAGLVTRTRLHNLVAEGMSRTLTLICAPAGYGKTTLLAEWIAGIEASADASAPTVCWLSFDQNDNDLPLFLNYLIAALNDNLSQANSASLAVLSVFPLPPLQTVLGLLINDLVDRNSPIILVLDDYQVISNPVIHEGVAFFIEHLPANIHLAVVTRSDPPMPLARLRAHGQLAEIRADDLRFTLEETTCLLNQVMGLNLSVDQLTKLDERTEGWAAGLQMAAIALSGQQDAALFVNNFSGSNRYILDYLIEEVLHRQPDDIQEFLLQTSVLENLSGPLCEAVTGIASEKEGHRSCQEILEYLERSNLFLIPQDSERTWYRYHRLFADLLRARLEQLTPVRVIDLHQRAARWYMLNQRMEEAIHHALQAGEDELAADWMSAQVPILLTQNGMGRLARWIKRLPVEAAARRPWLCIAQAWANAMNNQMDHVEPFLQAAEQAIRPEDPTDLQQEWLGQVACLRAELADTGADASRTIEMARRALGCLLPQDIPNLTFAHYMLGRAYLEQGDLNFAIDTLTENMSLCIHTGIINSLAPSMAILARAYRIQGRLQALFDRLQEGLIWIDASDLQKATVAGTAWLGLGEFRRERNELQAAEAIAQRSLELSLPWQNPSAICASYNLLARIHLSQGDLTGCAESIQKAEETIQGRTPFKEVKSDLYAAYVDLWLRTGQLSEASRWARRWEAEQAPPGFSMAREQDEITHARVLVAESRYSEALLALERLAAAARTGGRLGRLLEMRILQALALWASSDKTSALQQLETCLAPAEPEGYLRIFVDRGKSMQSLLSAYCSRPAASHLAYARRLLEAFPAGAAAQPSDAKSQPWQEPLTHREQEILGLVASGITNRQIAQQLILAEGTVKFYVHSILEKLGVHNRTQAIIAAKKQNLI